MSEFKHFDGGEPFLRPEKSFLLIYTDTDDAVSYAWLETEDDLLEVVEEVKGYGCTIVDAIEIGSYRDVVIEENKIQKNCWNCKPCINDYNATGTCQ